jgi:hypothetical protein
MACRATGLVLDARRSGPVPPVVPPEGAPVHAVEGDGTTSRVQGCARVPVTSPAELRALITAVASERGVLARCAFCGASRFCPFADGGVDAYEQFHQLHARCCTLAPA